MKQEYRVLPISSSIISVPVILFIEKFVVYVFIMRQFNIIHRFKVLKHLYSLYLSNTRINGEIFFKTDG